VYYELQGIEPEFSLKSNRPGIGDRYEKKYHNELRDRGFTIVKGNKAPLPKFYRSRIMATDRRVIFILTIPHIQR